MSERLQYLPALDGLRAIAVTSVLLYHLDIGSARGGFVGVDLFFVISGYLITTLLLRERSTTGRIGLGSFWVRRFKRLVPPLVVMTTATIAATRLWGLPEQWASIRWDAASALGYVANWRFVVADQSYFDSLLGPSPLRHTWSLAVEEQWYLLWPVVMVGLAALAVWRRRGAAIAACLVVVAALASATLMAVLYSADDPSRAYYGTDTRAQQLLVGAALAWLIELRPGLTRFGARTSGAWALMGALAIYLVVVSTTTDDAGWLYQGGFLAVSFLCAALVLGTTTPNVAAPLRWLTWGPLIWIGVRSYGIYLWHWPVIIFVGEPMGLDLPRVPLILAQVAVTLALADASHRFVERPTRTMTRRPAIVLGAWTGAAAVVVVACFVVLRSPTSDFSTATVFRPSAPGDGLAGEGPNQPSRFAQLNPAPSDDARAAKREQPLDDGDAPLGEGNAAAGFTPPERPNVLILGDSTAAALWDRMDPKWASDWYVQLMARLGCGIFDGSTIDSDADRPNPHPAECSRWRDEWRFSMFVVEPDVAVVMIGAWEVLDQRVDGVDYRFPSPQWYELTRANVREAIDIAESTGAEVVAMSIPCMEPSGDENTTARTDPLRIAALNEMLEEAVGAVPGARVADLASLLCPDDEPLRTVDGDPVRYDGVHLTVRGSDLVWSWLFPQLEELIR